eukprot:216143_1
MAVRKTRQSNRERKSLKESSLCVIKIPRRMKDDIKYVSLRSNHDTFAACHRRHGFRINFSGPQDGEIYRVKEFRLVNNYHFVLIDVWRDRGVQQNQIVSLDQLRKEDYFGAIPGYEEDLVAIGYFTPSVFKQNEIEDIEKNCITDIGNNQWYLSPMLFSNTNSIFQQTTKGMILFNDLKSYYPDLGPEYSFVPDSDDQQIHNIYSGMVYYPQLSKSPEFNVITRKHLIIARIKRSIANESTRYLTSELLDDDDYTLDIKMDSVFFGQCEELNECKSLIDSQMIFPKIVSYSFLKTLLDQTFIVKIDSGSIGLQTVGSIGTEKSLISNGVYVQRYLTGYGLMHHLKLDGINFSYNFKTIDFGLPLNWIGDHLQINHIVQVNRDKSQSRLKQGQVIKIKYNRKASVIYVSNLQYFNVNRHFVNTEQRLNEINSTKIRMKKVQGGYRII